MYESGAKDASAITSAQVVIVNGLGYDDFIDKILATSPNPSRTVIKAADIGKTDANDNPHIWYDLPRVLVIAGDIEAALSKQDPAGQTTYKQNLQVFLDSIIPTLDQINAIGAQYPGAAVAYTERVPEYLLAQAGLKVVSPASFAAAIEAGNEPSPADQAAMMALITHKQIRALIYNAQAESPATKALREAAEANNIPVVAVTETLPSAYQTYQAWQQAQIDALAKALAATK